MERLGIGEGKRMRRLLLTAALVCALASGGCASKYTGQENGKAEEQSNQAFAERSQNETAAGQTEAGLPEKDRQEESAETAGETADKQNGTPQAALKLQETVLRGMVWTASEKRMVYNTADNSFAWWCLYGIAAAGAEEGETEISIKTEKLKTYLSVLFEGNTSLPAIPESMSGFITPDEKNDTVVFHLSEAMEGSFTFSEPERIDETHVKIAGVWENGRPELTSPPTVLFYLVNRTGDDYPYTVQYMETEGYICNDILEGDRVFEP